LNNGGQRILSAFMHSKADKRDDFGQYSMDIHGVSALKVLANDQITKCHQCS